MSHAKKSYRKVMRWMYIILDNQGNYSAHIIRQTRHYKTQVRHFYNVSESQVQALHNAACKHARDVDTVESQGGKAKFYWYI